MNEAPTDAGSAAQRRQVTVLFADMADYTPLADKLGEEKTYLLMQRVHRELSEAVHDQGGTVQEMTGDGVMALFGAPVAIEDAPLRACRAALDIQARMAAVAGEAEANYGARPSFRVGLNSGPLIIGAVGDDRRMETTALGDTVNLASRIEAQAEGGTVLMSEATHALVEGFVEADYLGERELKGKAGPQKLWRLDAVREGVSRFDVAIGRGLTALVGRRREQEVLEENWRLAMAGAVRLVDIVGEAGIGKTRLVHEFRLGLPEGTFFLRGACTPDGRASPYLPFIEIVRTSFRIPDEADRAEIEDRLTRGLTVLGAELAATLPYLLNLLGQVGDDAALGERASETVGIRTRDAILMLLCERCRISPLVLLLEDLHWIDRASAELVRRSLSDDRIPRLLVITTRRPEYAPPWADAGAMAEVRLAPLSGGGTVDLLKSRLGVDQVPDDLARLITDKAEGNPLFVEELTSWLQDEGRLAAGPEGVRFEAGSAALPASLANLLMERFDHLEAGARAVLEAAAVVGRRFPPGPLAEIAGIEAPTEELLAALETADLVFRSDEDGGYEFRNALIRDAVYDSLLGPRKAELHGRAAAAFERLHANRLEEAADLLTHHYSLTDQADKAMRYLAMAGEKSLGVYALEEAAERFRAVLDLFERHPDADDDDFLADVLLGVARVHYFTIDFGSLIAMVEKYLPRIEALGDQRRLSRFLFETGYAHVFGARQDIGRPLLERALEIGQEIDDEVAIAYTKMGLMWHYIYWEPASVARRETVNRLGEEAIEVGRRIGDVWLTSKAMVARGNEAAMWGRPDEAVVFDLQLLELSRETGDPRPRGMGLWRLAYLTVI